MITITTGFESKLSKTVEGFGKVPTTKDEQTKLIQQICAYLEVKYWTDNRYPTIQEICERYEMPPTDFKELHEAIDEALIKRSLPKFVQATKRLPGDFDPRFVTAVSLVCDTLDKRSQTVKLKSIGLTPQRFKAFLRQADYREYYVKRIEDSFKDADQAAKLSLIRNIESGDLQSIKYFYEFTGQHNPQGDTLQMLNRLIMLFTEILVRHVDTKVIDTVLHEFDTKLLEIDLK